MPLISVIIPVYNTEQYLPACLDSVLGQTLADLEIIAVNDASTDASLAILNSYAARDGRLKVIDLPENAGVSVARNTGINAATGDYIGFVDSDDFIALDFYEKLYDRASSQKAEIVKGSITLLDEKGQPCLSGFYDINDEVRLNKAYFYHSFTSCLFSRVFLLTHQIYFPPHISHFEDPYFAIKAAIYARQICVEDAAHYFYYTRSNSQTKQALSVKNMQDIGTVIRMIVDLLKKADVSPEHEQIVVSFLREYSINLAGTVRHLPELHALALENIKYLKENFRIISPLPECMDEKALLDAYQKYDFVNEHQTQIKILVSYIKPSFLFKSRILTPIQLGCAVEEEATKDGSATEADLQWLHENCIKDNGFEGNLSALNRRLGFYTGTYWAWKNYEALGNPDYFGSFGYRRLLDPSFLECLSDYDLFVPTQTAFYQSLKYQLMFVHGASMYYQMIDLIERVYPAEVPAVKAYMQRCQGYFHELYVMKKDLFFDFAAWMYPLVQTYLEHYAMGNMRPKTDILLYWPPTKGADSRDLAFIFERLTGYYLDKLIRQGVKYKEITLFLTDQSLACNVKNVARVLRARLKKG